MSEQQSMLSTSDWFIEYMAPAFYVPLKLHSTLVVGSMGSGKTTFVLSLFSLIEKRLTDMGVDEAGYGFFHFTGFGIRDAVRKLSSIQLPKRYLYVFIDDAPATTGMHGRRSMSTENVEESQALVVVRHALKRMGYEGYIHIVYATQVYHLVDITIRRTSKLKIFKDYPEEPTDLKLVGMQLGREYMAALREITRMIYMPRNSEELKHGLGSAVVKLLARKRVVTLAKNVPRSITVYKHEHSDTTNTTDREHDITIELARGYWLERVSPTRYYIRTRENGEHIVLAKIVSKNNISLRVIKQKL